MSKLNEQARFERLESLYHRLTEADPEERVRILEQARAQDAGLATEAERLLNYRSTESEEQLLEIVRGDGASSTGEGADHPRQIGPYRISRVLGEGGMGIVFEAEQEEPIRRQVAIKLMRAALAGERAFARFDVERQSLALMTHPGIAQVYDAGHTEDGRPYFVMELVKGTEITTHADEQELDLEERLKLFRQVCAAVSHAHQKGVIHRDLKPSNVLVTTQEGRARPKVIDFGIAKALDSSSRSRPPDGTVTGDDRELGHPAPDTVHGEVIGTPEWMSPEQIRGDPVDTRSDVYALGILLYDLLTGAPPSSVDAGHMEKQTSAGQRLRQHVPDQTPLPPSRSGAQRWRLNPFRWHELDLIARTALAKDPADRYESVDRLNDDVTRFLEQQPLRAHPDGAWYRFRKLSARHVVATVSTLATVLALLIGGASLIIGLQAARAAERERAQEAEVARQVSEFLAGLFQSPDPLQSGGEALSAKDILDRGANQLRSEADLDPEVRGRLLQVIGDTYVGLGLGSDAQPLLEEASQVLRQSRDDNVALATTLRLRAMIALDDADPATARPLLDEAGQLLEDHADDSDFEWVPLFTDMARLVSQEGDYEAAIPWRQLALEHVETFHPQAPTLPRIRSNLATAYLRLAHYDLALPLLEQELDRWRAGKIDDAEVVDVLQVLGTTYGRTGRLQDGLEILEAGVDIERRIYGNESPGLGSMLYAQGLLLEAAGRYDDARTVSLDAVRLMESRGQRIHPTTLFALQTLGRTSFKQGHLERGREELSNALDVASSLKSQPFFSPLRVLQVVAEMELAVGSVELAREAVRFGARARRRLARVRRRRPGTPAHRASYRRG